MYIDWTGMIKGKELCFFVIDNLIAFPVSGFRFSEQTKISCVELNLRKQKFFEIFLLQSS